MTFSKEELKDWLTSDITKYMLGELRELRLEILESVVSNRSESDYIIGQSVGVGLSINKITEEGGA